MTNDQRERHVDIMDMLAKRMRPTVSRADGGRSEAAMNINANNVAQQTKKASKSANRMICSQFHLRPGVAVLFAVLVALHLLIARINPEMLVIKAAVASRILSIGMLYAGWLALGLSVRLLWHALREFSRANLPTRNDGVQ